MTARIVSINRSRGGVPKLPVDRAQVTANGLEGDKQRDRRFHGGPDRALCLYSLELIDRLSMEGHPITIGAIGENVTISGVDWGAVKPGTRLTLGAVEVEITSFTVPCKTIRKAFIHEDFTRISQKLHPGWSRVYARVLREGEVQQGDVVSVD
jgi:MOSC domain-containing protein YiiM